MRGCDGVLSQWKTAKNYLSTEQRRTPVAAFAVRNHENTYPDPVLGAIFISYASPTRGRLGFYAHIAWQMREPKGKARRGSKLLQSARRRSKSSIPTHPELKLSSEPARAHGFERSRFHLYSLWLRPTEHGFPSELSKISTCAAP
jgi:hypothetical protein